MKTYRDGSFAARELHRYKTKRFEKMLHLFSDLALGARFKYIEGNKEWVKISGTTIAEWDEGEKASNWIDQQICCFNEHNITNIYVNIL